MQNNLLCLGFSAVVNLDKKKLLVIIWSDLFSSRNCLIGASYHIKISDCAMFRPVYKTDYFRDQENDHDVLPLRWIPWEVYIMVGAFVSISLRLKAAFICSNENAAEAVSFIMTNLDAAANFLHFSPMINRSPGPWLLSYSAFTKAFSWVWCRRSRRSSKSITKIPHDLRAASSGMQASC